MRKYAYRCCRSALSAWVAVMMVLAIAPWAWAAKPVAVVAISPLQELFGDIQYVTEAAGVSDAGQMAMAMGGAYTQGWDRQRPSGLVVSVDEQGQFIPLAFLPITDVNQALAPLEPQFGKPRDAGNGVLELEGPQSVFLKPQNGWVYVAQKLDSFSDAPADPLTLIGDLNQDYDIAVRAYVQNVPQMYRDLATMQIEQGMRQGMQQQPGEDAAAFQMRQRVAQAQLKQLQQFFQETDQLTVGWSVDSAQGTVFVDFSLTAVPDTGMAKQLADMKNAKTNLAGFLLDNAAISLVGAGSIGQEQQQQMLDMLANVRQAASAQLEKDEDLPDERSREAAQKLLDDLMSMIEDTVKSGRMDIAGSVTLEPQNVNLIMATHLADAKKLEDSLREIVRLAEAEPDFPGIKFNADQHGPVQFHSMAIPVPASEDEARQMFGDQLHVSLGIGTSTAYLALGRDAVKMTKQAIDTSQSVDGSQVPPSQLMIAVQPILAFANEIQPNPGIDAALEALQQSQGRDHVLLRGTAIDNGCQYRLQIEDGVLRAVGRAVNMVRGG